MAPIKDHPLRYKLANELHARPFPTVRAPSTAVFLALKRETNAVGRDRQGDLDQLMDLLDRHGAVHPQPNANHYSGQIGRHSLKWEQHTEFVTYTVFSEGLSDRPFDPIDFDVFPSDWLEASQDLRITSVIMRIEQRPDNETVRQRVSDWFVPESVAVSHVLDDAAIMAADFRIDPAGHQRMALFVSKGTGERRIGRIVQRMFEIEMYKSMSMLGFSRARAIAPRVATIDAELSELMSDMTHPEKRSEDTLHALLNLSSELETLGARSSFRFGATAAYRAIVDQRIEILREQRFEGRQTFGEFMMRRYDPAMRTVKSAEDRLIALADRSIRAGDLLRTRVDVERSAQNQELLSSMDRRADAQLQLQKTVEGLSVVAISYYAVSLATYVLYPVSEALNISKGMLSAAVTVPVVLIVWWAVRRIQRRHGH